MPLLGVDLERLRYDRLHALSYTDCRLQVFDICQGHDKLVCAVPAEGIGIPHYLPEARGYCLYQLVPR